MVSTVERAKPWISPKLAAISPTLAGCCLARWRSRTSSWSPMVGRDMGTAPFDYTCRYATPDDTCSQAPPHVAIRGNIISMQRRHAARDILGSGHAGCRLHRAGWGCSFDRMVIVVAHVLVDVGGQAAARLGQALHLAHVGHARVPAGVDVDCGAVDEAQADLVRS